MPALDLRCAFCGRSQREVPKLVAGPTVFICGTCVTAASTIGQEGRVEANCSFCAETRVCYQGRNAAICAECSGLAADICGIEFDRSK